MKNLLKKLSNLRKEMDYFQKNKKGFGYYYVSGYSILSRLQTEMNDAKLLLYPSITEQDVVVFDYINKDSHKKTEIIVKSIGAYTWVDTESGETLEVPWSFTGSQTDASQAFGSGLTYAERYFLMKFFNIPTDEADPDKIRSEMERKNLDKPEKQFDEEKFDRNSKIDFGVKYKGIKWCDVNKGYLIWLSKQVDKKTGEYSKNSLTAQYELAQRSKEKESVDRDKMDLISAIEDAHQFSQPAVMEAFKKFNCKYTDRNRLETEKLDKIYKQIRDWS